jgi:hypothetical protein
LVYARSLFDDGAYSDCPTWIALAEKQLAIRVCRN